MEKFKALWHPAHKRRLRTISNILTWKGN